MLMGGKEALSDGMGMAAKWMANQRATSQLAGGNDPQMQCLYSQATGGMMPGVTGSADPGNMFGDYYDTVIEYPMIVDPCTAPQCNGKVNPTVLLMQAFGRMGMGGPGAAFGAGMPGPSGPVVNPLSSMGQSIQNPLLTALMSNPASGIPPAATSANGTNQAPPATNGSLTPSASAAAPAPLPQQPQSNSLAAMMQNPQLMQMMQMMQMFMKNNQGTPPMNANPAFSPFGNLGFPGLGGMFL